MKKSDPEQLAYKTEEQLKEEARLRAQRQAELARKQKPKSKAEKRVENYWYHYKWATIGGVFALLLVVFFVRDIIFKVDADLTLVMATGTYLGLEDIDRLSEALSETLEDLNGDGRVELTVDYMAIVPDSWSGEDMEEELPAEEGEDIDPLQGVSGGQDYAYIMKLTTLLAADTDPLFFLDEDNLAHIVGGAGGDASAVFQDLSHIPGAQGCALPVENTRLAEAFPELAGMSFYLRAGGDQDRRAEYRQQCLEFLATLARN